MTDDWALERLGPRTPIKCDHTTCPGCNECSCHDKPAAAATPKRGERPKRARLERRNTEQWAELRRDVEGILKRFEQHQESLIERANAARPDGYPAGGDSGRSSDVTDSTLSTVLAREKAYETNPAVRAVRAFNEAIEQLDAAERHRINAFPPEPQPDDPTVWCASCLRIKAHNPIDTDRYAKTNTNCSWCSAFLKEHGFLPPKALLRKHARGDRIYDVDVTKAVKDWVRENMPSAQAERL